MSFWKKLFKGKPSEKKKIQSKSSIKSETSSITSSQKDNTSKAQVDSIDKNTYSSIKIGNQEWMTENLNVDKFRNGDSIPEAKSSLEWEKAGEDNKPICCCYDYEPNNSKKYGKIYNIYAVIDNRELAPKGWHIPSDLEWTKLTDYLGSEVQAGGKLKSTSLWKSPNKGATNECGFSGLPGGTCDNYGKFNNLGLYGSWWSSTGVNGYKNVWIRILTYNFGVVSRGYPSGKYGFSVRCLSD